VFTPGGPSSYVVVSVLYNRNFITGAISGLLGVVRGSGSGGNWKSTLLTSTVVFQNEPYP
jgi:hypothetical protein